MPWQLDVDLYHLAQGDVLLTEVQATLWRAYSIAGSGQHLDLLQTFKLDQGPLLSFTEGPQSLEATRDLCLAIRRQGEPGFWYRSGRVQSFPTVGETPASVAVSGTTARPAH